MGKPTGQMFADLLLTQIGDEYVWGAKPNPEEEDPKAEDCSGLVHWGANHLHVDPPFPDGSQIQREFCRKYDTTISIDDARTTPGALLFNSHHVAVSLGHDDKTIEAHSRTDGVVSLHIGNRFEEAALVPGMDYGPEWEDV